MIENERQYKITKKWAEAFEKAAKNGKAVEGTPAGLVEAARKSYLEQAKELRQQMQEYRDRNKPSM